MFGMMTVANGRSRAPLPAGGDAYEWYPSLDLNDIPFHTASGDYGSQLAIQTPAAPVTTSQTSVSTWAAFETAALTPGTEITVTASIDGTGNNVSGSMTDIDVIINSGVVVKVGFLGTFGSGHTFTRVRFRGPTVGVHSGGQMHNTTFFGATSDIIFDGLDLSGGGASKEAAIGTTTTLTNTKWAIVNCRGHSGNHFYLGNVSHLVAAGNAIYSGADTTTVPPDDEAWVFRHADGVGPIVHYDNDYRNDRFHNIRAHTPSGATTSGYIWIKNNVLVDLTEARIFWNVRANGGALGTWEASWFLNNTIYAEDNSPTLAPDITVSANVAYTRIQENTFYGDFTSGNISSSATDSVVSDNTFNGSTSAPAYGGPGDPTGIDWSP